MNAADSACDDTAVAQSGYPHDSRDSVDYTYSLDKLSCVRQFYFIHMTFAYLVVLSGIACFLTRLFPETRKWHAFFGRTYIICMLWCMATSLLIHNTGLPVGVLISFLFVLTGLTVGWGCVKLHQFYMHNQVIETVQEALVNRIQGRLKDVIRTTVMNEVILRDGTEFTIDLKNSMNSVMNEVIRRGRTEITVDLKDEMKKATISINTSRRSWQQRMLSFKAAHGMLMFMSWINIFGRMFGSNQSGDFTCHTYPVYKRLDSPRFKGLNQSLTFVPIEDPNYSKLPWAHTTLEGWGMLFSIGMLLVAAVVGLLYVWCYDRIAAVAWSMYVMCYDKREED